MTTNKSEELLPCPFCGDSLIEISGNEWEEDLRARCLGCLASSGRYRTRNEAIKACNARPTTSDYRAAITQALTWMNKYCSCKSIGALTEDMVKESLRRALLTNEQDDTQQPRAGREKVKN